MTAHRASRSSQAVDMVAIGASAGGVQALLRILQGLPARFTLPIVAVLHVPDDRPSGLVALFGSRMQMRVCEAADKTALRPGTLYFAPPGYHLLMERDYSCSLSCEAPHHYSRPSIDLLFESAALACRSRLAALLLTGANADGAAGLAAVGEAGGLTVVQDPAEAQARAMPDAALALRRPDHVFSLYAIHNLLCELGRPHDD